MKTETYVCQSCGIDVVRPVTKGQRPKWCLDCRARGAWNYSRFTCVACGAEVEGTGTKYCTVTCSNRAKPPRPRKPKRKPERKSPEAIAAMHRSRRGPLRAAVEDGKHEATIEAIKTMVEVDAEGCWIWQRNSRDGYAFVNLGKRYFQVHRLALEAKLMAPLGSQHCHHMCATTLCVNPDHLQPVTHRENAAEMMARQSYLNRIRELESALASVDPTHPLLGMIAVA
jgi:hypothetical protein